MDEGCWQKAKASEVVGTFVNNPFFLSLRGGGTSSEITVPLFDGLPVHTIAHLGCYGESYLPFFPMILLELPPPQKYWPPQENEWKEKLPPQLVSCLKGNVDVECFIVVHSKPALGPCQHFTCENEDEMNLMLHPWLFRGCIFNELFSDLQMVEMGVFGGNGIQPVHQDLKSAHTRGAPFDVLEKREVSVHNQCFSPANAQVQLQPEAQIAFFFSVARTQTSRQIITFHVVPLTTTTETSFLGIAEEASTFSELCEAFVREEELLGRGVEYLLGFLEWVGVLSEERLRGLEGGAKKK